MLELRGLSPSPADQARLDVCHDPAELERWCQRAKTAANLAELFELCEASDGMRAAVTIRAVAFGPRIE